MNTCLLRNSSALVRISLVPYKYVPTYMCLRYGYVLDTDPYICTKIEKRLRKNS